MDRQAAPVTARTMPAGTRRGPLRRFVAMENSGAIVLIVATITAMAWSNSAWASTYEALWTTRLGIQVGTWELSNSLRDWVNEGLMALFFFVAGLEIRREFDMGELRERRRLAAPVFAALGGMVVPALLYLAINAGADSMRGWGIVVGTDTAFALGVLSLSRGVSPRVRTFLLTLVVIDDAIALTVIAVAYTDSLSPLWLLIAVAAFGLILALRAAGVRHLSVYALVAVGMWLAVSASGLHATIAGVAAGLVATAYPPGREGLRRAGVWWHRFRMAPTPELAHRASRSMAQAISPNELLQRIFHPWSSYLIVPLFALANAGLALDGDTLSRAATSPITLGIIVGLVIGKMIGIVGSTWLASRPVFGGFPITVAWPSLIGASAVAGIGFTVSLLIADISFVGDQLEEAKLGVLVGSTLAAALGFTVFRVVAALPSHVRTAGAAHLAAPLPDLAAPVEPDIDHVLGDPDAPVMLVWYADLQCHHCAHATTTIDHLRARFGADLAIAHRHLPLTDIHAHAQLAAEATEAAASQGRFQAMWDALLDHQDDLSREHLTTIAAGLGLDTDQFTADLRSRRHAPRIERDITSADDSGVIGTPTFFINNRRYDGHLDLAPLTDLIGEALATAPDTRPLAPHPYPRPPERFGTSPAAHVDHDGGHHDAHDAPCPARRD
ncbi:Na(+)/H(+) antiporter NhaA 2 [Demequina sediminis]|nr:Na(+)/H(+) antiporter NhaA 2 [Demequina sediminis]